MEKDKYMVFDPKIFISQPYLKCPQCRRAETFGVLWISGTGYTRRCLECRFTKSFKLPQLKKKIVYLDQFVISEMMKAINKKLGKAENVNRFWLTLFEKIDRLLKLQLIICPDSSFHRDESALYQFEAHRRMYEHLSNGASFYDAGTIRRFQISDYFRQFIQGEKKPEPKLEIKHIIHGHLNDWQERIRISVNFDIKEEELDQLKATKAKVNNALSKIFERWKTEKDKKFRDLFIEEGMAFGKEIVQSYFENLSKLYYLSIGRLTVTAEESLNIIMNDANTIIHGLKRYLPETEDPNKENENLKKIIDFLLSEKMLEIPSNRLTALLWSAIADQTAHGGRKKLPSSGIANDISMVSTILPYCDAMFIDREMYGLLDHPEVKKEVKNRYKTSVFSAANKEEFLAYLNNIEKGASKEHLEKVKEVYGTDWPRPFLEMYEYEH